MNRTLYKNAVKNICVSDKTIDELIVKAGKYNAKHVKRRLIRRAFIPVAALLAASLITVSAASGLGVGDIFKGFFTQIFKTQLTDKQMALIEKYGSTTDKEFSKGGVHLKIDGVLADHSSIYLKYTIWADKDYDPADYSLIMSRKLYLADAEKGIKRGIYMSVGGAFTQDKNDPNKFYHTDIVNMDKDRQKTDTNLTFVMKSDQRYHATGVDVKNAYNKSGENKKLNIKLDTQYGSIMLESVGYDNGKLKIGVNSSGYYELPQFYLRDKSSGKIYSPYNSIEEIEETHYYTFEMSNIVMLGKLELVMPEEYDLSFPLSFVEPKTIDLRDKAYTKYGETKIDQIKLSPLSISISGTIPEYYATSGSKNFDAEDCSIRLKNKTVINNLKPAGGGYETEDNSFRTDILFNAPVDTNDMEALIIKKVYGSEQLEIPLN